MSYIVAFKLRCFDDCDCFSEIPQELVRQAQGAEVHVNMVDKRTEEFVPPKPVLRPFSGTYCGVTQHKVAGTHYVGTDLMILHSTVECFMEARQYKKIW